VNTYTNHIASFASRLLLVAAVLVYSYTTAIADNAKKSVAGRQKPAASSVLPMANGTVYASVKAVASRTKALAKTTGKVNTGNDSTGRDNRILFVRASGDVLTSRIELATEEPLIEIGIYNMLGKRVMDVYKGASGRGQQEFTQSLAELPDGVYICILQGDNFRKAEKFYFRR